MDNNIRQLDITQLQWVLIQLERSLELCVAQPTLKEQKASCHSVTSAGDATFLSSTCKHEHASVADASQMAFASACTLLLHQLASRCCIS